MSLSVGARVGSYEILAPIGKGGMGEVYRARDSKLKREVAIKVLPEAFSGDRERMARFHREAEVLASLNHPNIAQIYGVEEHALVMELVPGETLQSPLPVATALHYAKQIAEALEAAHEKGIIHRDLKPANVKVTPDGVVKVLDFGLAAVVPNSALPSGDPEDSPTLTMPATRVGEILGTAAYMSPEQACGRPVDKRADIWSFGVVLFEMLSGKRLFQGETVSHTLAEVLNAPIDFNQLPRDTPQAIRGLLRRCLERNARSRLRDIGEARILVEDILRGGSGDVAHLHGGNNQRLRPVWLPLAGMVAIVLLFTLWTPWRATPPTAASVRLSAYLGANVSLINRAASADALLSPDGSLLAFLASNATGDGAQLYIRPLNQLQATPLQGTEGAYGPFFSPDGQWLAFFSGRSLKKIRVSGGAVETLCEAPDARGGTWAEDGTIIMSPNVAPIPNAVLHRVSSGGGKAEPFTSFADGEVTQRYPQVLPGGHSVLFTSSKTIGAFDDAAIVVLNLKTGARKVVLNGGYHGRYLSSGHLVYLHKGTLFAVPFDLDGLEAKGQPVPVIEGIMSNSLSGGAEVAISASGALVYVPGPTVGGQSPIHWLDRTGNLTLLRATPANWANLQFSPDGNRLAMEIVDGQEDIWVSDWARDTLTRITSDPASDRKPVWTPDGRRIAFASTRGSSPAPNLYWQLADGTGEATRLTISNNLQLPGSWHPDGKVLAFEELNPKTGYDLMLLPMAGDERSGWKPGTPTVFLSSTFAEREPAFSPDGRWIAYSSTETGRQEVYVRPFPGPGSRWQVSTTGGAFPTWSRSKHELIYNSGQLTVVPYSVEGDSFRAGTPSPWPNGRTQARGSTPVFGLHPDGQRLALRPATQSLGNGKTDHVTFIFNFFDELRRVAPLKK